MGTSGDEIEIPSDKFFWIVTFLVSSTLVSTFAQSQYGVVLTVSLLIVYFYKWSLPVTLSYDFAEEKFKACTEEEVQYDYHRRAQEQPPVPYPNGWAIALEVRDLKIGEMKRFMIFGKDLLFYRGKTSQVVHLKCPISGIDLTNDNNIKDDVIYCTRCGIKGDRGCGISAGEFRELHDLLYIWYHADGIPPNWEPTPQAELISGPLEWKGTAYTTVACHPQDIHENGVDDAHVNSMHASISMAGVLGVSRNRIDYGKLLCLEWELVWKKTVDGIEKKEGEQGKITSFTVVSTVVKLFGIPVVQMPGMFQNEGPYYNVDYINLCGQRMAFVFGAIPVDNLKTTIITLIFGGRYTPLVPRMLKEEVCQIQRDGIVWNSKVHKRNPIWVKDWKQMSQWRRWYSQFYSKQVETNHRQGTHQEAIGKAEYLKVNDTAAILH